MLCWVPTCAWQQVFLTPACTQLCSIIGLVGTLQQDLELEIQGDLSEQYADFYEGSSENSRSAPSGCHAPSFVLGFRFFFSKSLFISAANF